MLAREKFFLSARAALRDVDGGEKTAIRMLPVENQFHVSSPFELLQDQLVHARSGIDQRGGNDRKRSAFFDLARCSEHLARNFQGARINTAGHRATATAMHAVVSTGHTCNGVKQNKNIPACF